MWITSMGNHGVAGDISECRCSSCSSSNPGVSHDIFYLGWVIICYASAFRHQRHYVFGFSVHPSVPPTKAQNTIFPPVHGSVGLIPTITLFRSVHLSVHPSRKVSGHFPENAWREWPEIWHADVSWPPSELMRLWSQFVDFSSSWHNFWLGEMGEIWGFRAFPGKCMEGIAWNLACWCILTTFRTDEIMVSLYWFSSFWLHLNLVKPVKFGVSRHFLENTWRELPGILHADQSGTKLNLVTTLVTICNGLPKLVANIGSHIHHLVNTGLTVGFLVKWLQI